MDISERKGKLKIFFGYAPGAGKTYAMLQAAHLAAGQGIDVVAGYVNTHKWPQTDALLKGLERLPACLVNQGHISRQEFDIDGALKRKPQLILIDELAHTNASGSRHVKRYQDIQELLNAGIDVYTTVNVQHIESLNDTVASITGLPVPERIPDSVFDKADHVELTDIEPKELLDRLTLKKAWNGDREDRINYISQEPVCFFTIKNLTALREIALRRCADRMNQLTENSRMQNKTDYHTDEHILVCLSSSPSNGKIIRTAARMAKAFRGTFTALFVETPAFSKANENDKNRLRENMRLARQLGAAIETTYGEDVPYQIAEFARLSGVSKIVIGRSTATRKSIFSKPLLTERLIATAPNLDIHIIPDGYAENRKNTSSEILSYFSGKSFQSLSAAMLLKDIGKSILVLLAVTLAGFSFRILDFTEATIITVYILGVLIVSVITTNRLCSFLASIFSVLVFNFFFTVPRFTFHFYDPGYLATFVVMFIASVLTGSLASRLKDNAKQSARSAFRTKILLETNQLLQKERDEQSVITATAGQLTKLLKRDLVIYLTDGRNLSSPSIFRSENDVRNLEKADLDINDDENAAIKDENTDDKKNSENQNDLTCEGERAVAEWVLRNNRHAGATTDTLSNAKCLYLAIRVNQQVYGVVGISMDETPLDSFENGVLLSILGECALALENIKNAREKEEAAILAKNEQLRANLLRSISHDLRTPLTSISGNASNLLSNYQTLDDEARVQIFTDIYDDSLWLINLVENLLAITKIGEGRVHMNQSAELIDEVIAEALRHINRKSKEHKITVTSTQDFILAYIDARLIVQVIINLVDNAIKYTPAGSLIEIHSEIQNKWVIVSVSDNGMGIPDSQKPRIFDMFYSGANKVADSRRSLGLGLSLCKSIITAHGGTISISDNHPHGSVFTFTLPAGEVRLHE